MENEADWVVQAAKLAREGGVLDTLRAMVERYSDFRDQSMVAARAVQIAYGTPASSVGVIVAWLKGEITDESLERAWAVFDKK